jgi:hypothetical protein
MSPILGLDNQIPASLVLCWQSDQPSSAKTENLGVAQSLAFILIPDNDARNAPKATAATFGATHSSAKLNILMD